MERRPRSGILSFCLTGPLAQGQVAVAPTNVNFTYVQGAVLPAAQKVAVKTGSGTPAYTTAIVPTLTTASALWLTATPDTGVLPANVNFRVNPTGLETDTYTAAVGFMAVTGEGDYSAAPPSTDGFIMTTSALTALWPSQPASPFPMNPPPAVTIGGNPATVQLLGAFHRRPPGHFAAQCDYSGRGDRSGYSGSGHYRRSHDASGGHDSDQTIRIVHLSGG